MCKNKTRCVTVNKEGVSVEPSKVLLRGWEYTSNPDRLDCVGGILLSTLIKHGKCVSVCVCVRGHCLVRGKWGF